MTPKKPEELFATVFVTVGNGRFDPLIKEIDRLKEIGKIPSKVIIQIGHGSYEPKHCEFFKFAPKLHEYYDKASFVICHGGPGTVFEILRRKLPVIALANRDRTDPRHQVEYLEGISAETEALLYCPDVKELEKYLKIAEEHDFIPYVRPECKIHELLNEFLDEVDEKN